MEDSSIKRARKFAQKIIDVASKGKVKYADNYHGRLPNDLEREILSQPEAVYLSEGREGRLIFSKDENIVVTEGLGQPSAKGNIVTSYGPDGPRGESGAAIFGGSPNDPGLPITSQMIREGKVPIPGGGTLPPGIPIWPEH